MHSKRTSTLSLAMVLTLALGVGACGDSPTDAIGGEAPVAIQFATVSPAGSAALSARPELGAPGGVQAALTIAGSNGTLALTDVRLIVTELRLKRANANCPEDDEGDASDACEYFQVGPTFVDLPLEGEAATTVEAQIAAGSYEELEFEIDDLELDDDDDDNSQDEMQQAQELLEQIRQEFPNWPEDASLLVEGTFTPEGGSAVPFFALFEAEVEIELELNPPLVVSADDASRTVTVDVSPTRWFTRADGTVINLAQFDIDRVEEIPEFEVEIEGGELEEGFESAEVDDEGDDDDD